VNSWALVPCNALNFVCQLRGKGVLPSFTVLMKFIKDTVYKKLSSKIMIYYKLLKPKLFNIEFKN
jgi:hypothetical protein